jgi:enamine deaminase RidA (YjgF/YER057c/UK114 family)
MTAMPTRQRVLTGTIWEERIGFSRAIRVGDMVFVSGTIAADEHGNILHPGSPHLQTLAAFEKAERAMLKLGASRTDTVRTRIYLTNIALADEAGRAHQEFFRDTMPVATMLQVGAFVSPLALVEIEIDAIVGSASDIPH